MTQGAINNDDKTRNGNGPISGKPEHTVILRLTDVFNNSIKMRLTKEAMVPNQRLGCNSCGNGEEPGLRFTGFSSSH